MATASIPQTVWQPSDKNVAGGSERRADPSKRIFQYRWVIMQFYTYADLFHNTDEDESLQIENAILYGIDLELVGHFGNAIRLSVSIESASYSHVLFPEIFGNRIPRVLQSLFDLLDLSTEDGRKLSSVKDIACRVAFKSDRKISAIGHFLKDKWMPLSLE